MIHTILIIAGVLILILVWAIIVSNRLRVLLVKISEAESGIDVALTKRHDALTKLVTVVKAHAKHEAELFSSIVKLRSKMSVAEKCAANNGMDEIMKKINVTAEAYPELRSANNYIQLQKAIVEIEGHLQAARRLYNMNVSAFNQAITIFPNSIIASFAHHDSKEFFEADGNKRGDVIINL